jgi:hypothetical protein
MQANAKNELPVLDYIFSNSAYLGVLVPSLSTVVERLDTNLHVRLYPISPDEEGQ